MCGCMRGLALVFSGCVYVCVSACTSHDPNNLRGVFFFTRFVAFMWVISLIDSPVLPPSLSLFLSFSSYYLSSSCIATLFIQPLFPLHSHHFVALPFSLAPSFSLKRIPHRPPEILTASQSSPYALDEQ